MAGDAGRVRLGDAGRLSGSACGMIVSGAARDAGVVVVGASAENRDPGWRMGTRR